MLVTNIKINQIYKLNINYVQNLKNIMYKTIIFLE